MTPLVRKSPPLWEGEPTDEELGWADIPVNLYGEVEDDAAPED